MSSRIAHLEIARTAAIFFLLCAAIGAAPALLSAQGTDASIDGRVVTASGATPLAGATITVRNVSTGFTSSTHSTATGRFILPQLPLGGPYDVTAKLIGYEAVTRSGYRLTLGARITVDFTMTAQATQVATVVSAIDTALLRSTQRIGGSTRIGARALVGIPTVGRNFTDLAALAPTVGSEFSIGGARATSTDVRIDGLQARNMLRGGELGRGPYTLSMEAIREFEVITNLYDVTQGRQGGGTISAVTNSGTNDFRATLFTYTRNDALSGPRDFLGRARALRQSDVWQMGGSIGGAIVRDKIHYFAAFDRQQASVPLAIADLRTTQDEIDAQIAKDSLTRFVNILHTKYGVDAGTQVVGVFSRAPAANTGFARLDWQLGENHQLTVRDNFSNSVGPNDGVGDQVLAIVESRSSSKSVDNQTLASLRSTLGATVQNELKLGFSLADRSLTPNTNIPRGFVRVRSALPDGTIGDVRLQFGGNRLAPEHSGEREYQLVNTLYWHHGSQLITLGTDNTLTYLRTFIPTDEGGLFEFDSLGAFDNRVASRYTRQVPLGAPPYAHQYVLDAGLFAQTEWRATPSITGTLGVRYDVTSFRTPAERNAAVETAFGLHTDNTPTDWSKIQPRAQVTWDAFGDGRRVLRVGGGAFAAQPHYYLQANNIFFNGTQLADLTLTGAAVPTPNYQAYRTDLGTVPGVPAGTTPPAYVNLMGADFRTPLTWKGSASYSERLWDHLAVTGTFILSSTTHNYQYFDRNLRPAAAFTLDNEDGRSVFVPASTIPANGRTTARNAYVNPAFTHVLELVSTGRAHASTAIINGTLELPRNAQVRASYTYNRSRDQSTFSCCIARTSSLLTPVKSDPRDLSGSWGPSDYDFRHKVVAYGEMPVAFGITVGARYVGASGRAFSLTVNGDINGDDYSGNDLAFVFDPDDPATPTAVAASMRKLLANASSSAQECIRKNLGRIADRNSCSAPWTQRVDLRLAKRFATIRGQGAELVVDVYNFTNLLNSKWGGQFLLPQGISASNPTTQQLALLNVVGFSQATHTYSYTVNENVGVLRKRGDPYQLQLGVRYTF